MSRLDTVKGGERMAWPYEQGAVLEQRGDIPQQGGPPIYPWQYYAATPAQWAAAMCPPAAPAPAQTLPGGVQKVAYTGDEAAQALGVSRSAVYNMIHMSGFPSMKLRGRRLISAELLAEWVRRQVGG